MKINTKPKYSFSYHQYANNNFTFALLDGDQYLTTPFMCKDYLQDIFWSEYTGGMGECCGLSWKQGMFPLTPRMRLAIHGGKNEMASRASDLQAFINLFDTAQGFALTEVLVTEDPHLVVVDFSDAWSSSNGYISALSTLIRVGGMFKPGEDVVEYLKRMAKPMLNHHAVTPKDTYFWVPDHKYMIVECTRLTPEGMPKEQATIYKLFALLKGLRPTSKWSDFKSMNFVHGFGIMNDTKFPVIEL